jgi:hypothetical protein
MKHQCELSNIPPWVKSAQAWSCYVHAVSHGASTPRYSYAFMMFITNFNKHLNTFFSLTEHITQQSIHSAYKNTSNTRIKRRKATFTLGTEYARTQIRFMKDERQTLAVTFTALPVHNIASRGQILILRRGPWFFKDVQPCGRKRDLWRSVAIGWTEKLHATAMRWANRGSEDVKLELTTMGPGIGGANISTEDSSYGNAPLCYNSM